MSITVNVGNSTVLTFDITNQDIEIPRGKLSNTPNQSTASLCVSAQCYKCTEVNCHSVRCTDKECNEKRCTNCTVVRCDCDCNSDS